MHVIDQGEGGEQGDVLCPSSSPLPSMPRSRLSNDTFGKMKRCSRIWTTSTFDHSDRVGEVYYLLQDPCSSTPTSVCTVGRPSLDKSGTRPQACDALERVARTVNPGQSCGEDPVACPSQNRGSRSLALQWGTQLSLPPTLRELLLSIKSCWIASPMSQMSSPRGCSAPLCISSSKQLVAGREP